MEDKLVKARGILLNPNFNKLTVEQIVNVYRVILASGVTKEQIAEILKSNTNKNVSYLESLPRDVFKQMVEIGKIQGRDLIYLCNSSPLLRQHCLQDEKDINGKIIKQQAIYYDSLVRMGIRLSPDEIPSEKYLKVMETSTFAMIDPFTDSVIINRKDPKYVVDVVSCGYWNALLDINGDVWKINTWEDDVPTGIILKDKKIKQITAKEDNLFFLSEQGEVYYKRLEENDGDEGIVSPIYKSLNIFEDKERTLDLGKILKIVAGNYIFLINEFHDLFVTRGLDFLFDGRITLRTRPIMHNVEMVFTRNETPYFFILDKKGELHGLHIQSERIVQLGKINIPNNERVKQVALTNEKSILLLTETGNLYHMSKRKIVLLDSGVTGVCTNVSTYEEEDSYGGTSYMYCFYIKNNDNILYYINLNKEPFELKIDDLSKYNKIRKITFGGDGEVLALIENINFK